MNLKSILILTALALATNALACIDQKNGLGFLPQNNFKIPVGMKRTGGLSEEQFNKVIDKIEELYSPIVSNLGGKLVIERKWDDATVNAYAQRQGKNWNVSMFGGLARHSTITEDGFALVLCHEIGHHMAGAPKKGGGTIWGGGAWASNEGQSDYFATTKCLRKAFLNDNNTDIIATLNAPKELFDGCEKTFKKKEEIEICVRGGMSGMSVANLFAALRNGPAPKFDTPDPAVVGKTDHAHPATQCRLDTYYQGAICDVADTIAFDDKDETIGACHKANGDSIGLRPLCWFKPAN